LSGIRNLYFCLSHDPGDIDKDGFVEIPQKPGIGVEINEEAIAEYV